MRAKLKGLHSPDIDALENWSPGDAPFGFEDGRAGAPMPPVVKLRKGTV